MDWTDLVMDLFRRIAHDLEEALRGAGDDLLHTMPAPGTNTIAWLGWHLTRSHDRNVSELLGLDQLWISEEWHVAFGREADPSDTGYRHASDEVAAFRTPDGETLIGYHRAVLDRVLLCVAGLRGSDLSREVTSPTLGDVATIRQRLVGVLSEGFQHVGQAAYLRGVLQGPTWR